MMLTTLEWLICERRRFGDVRIYYGARTPRDLLFAEERRGDFIVAVQVNVEAIELRQYGGQSRAKRVRS